jgi:uncharacterized protein Usg
MLVLVTVEIFYWMPDYPHVLQEFILQGYDTKPDYPWVNEYLNFWEDKIEAQIECVELSDSPIENSCNFIDSSNLIH